MIFFSLLKKQISDIEKRVPLIPDFSDLNNIGKIALVSFWITVIYSFTQIEVYSQFYDKLWYNVKNFIPYLILQLLFLILFSKLIKKIKPFFSILLIVFINFICLYIIQSLIHQSANFFFDNLPNSFIQLYVSIGIIFLYLIYFDWREKNLDPANSLAKLMFLQSKMRPHFLFNTLNSVVSLIKKDPETAKKMLLNLSELLRVSIKEEDITTMYSLKEELDLCDKYLAIEKIRLGERLSIAFNIDENLMDAKVPKLFLQPLIENSILHGIQNLENGGQVDIKITKNLINNLVIEIKNPNIKLINKKIDGNKVALKNIKERLNIYFNNNVIFKTISYDDIYYVSIEIPYIKIIF